MKHTAQTTVSCLIQQGFCAPEAEYEFHPERGWKMDFCWASQKVAWEIHGAVWGQGRHTRGGGFTEDRAKMNEAQLLGWVVIETTTQQVESGLALAWLERALGQTANLQRRG